MIDSILRFSIQWRVLVVAAWLMVVGFGLWVALRLPIDAIPDFTTNQVQINTVAPAFAPLEIEKYITLPVEVALSTLPRKQEIRSISQFGLSQVTVTFEDGVDPYWARQLVLERLQEAAHDLPPEVHPELAPISTGLGEIFQFTLERVGPDGKPVSPTREDLMELRSLLDWFISPALRTVPGVIEVNSFGGLEKQYEVRIDPRQMASRGVSLEDVHRALARNNRNAGGAHIERGGEQVLLRGVGLIESPEDIRTIVVAIRGGDPIYVRDVADVGVGSEIRQGAATVDGRGETVMGMALLLKGENSRTVTRQVRERLELLQKSLPAGVAIRPFYDRSTLVNDTIATASRNLVEGGLLVVAVLFLFLLQLRAGLIVSSTIPLAMLVAIIGMYYFGISANLMSLGAIDFGLIVDAAVIIVENCVRHLSERRHALGRALRPQERRDVIFEASVEVRRASQLGELIIIAAYIPIVSLAGIEGKMFRPMAFTVILALSGALLLSLTLIPALCAIFLRETEREREHVVLDALQRAYQPLLAAAVSHRLATILVAAVLVLGSVGLFTRLGAEFLPELDEGALAIHHGRLRSASLTQTVRETTTIESILLEFPEVTRVISRIGRPEIATDPMGPDMVDTYVFLAPRSEWRSAATREELVERMEEALKALPGVSFSFSQPIKFRMLELIEGVGMRSDVGVKIYGDDLDTLRRLAGEVGEVLEKVPGAEDVRAQQISGLPVMEIKVRRDAIARHGINVSDVQEVVETAIAGTRPTVVLEGFRRFPLVIRFPEWARNDVQAIGDLPVSTPDGNRLPLRQLADIRIEEGPAQVNRENGRRLISVEANVRGRDMGGFVDEARSRVEAQVKLPAGYVLTWGGMYEHMESGRNRLLVVVPVTFLVIFLMLFATFGSVRDAALIFTGVPFAVTGGIVALLARDMTFSMSAAVGFIAVSGVAVLNGVVMLTFVRQLRERGRPLLEAILEGSRTRLRPVLMTAAVAAVGFIPMAISTGTGAEVQKPLATVVIGGVVTSTLLTLLVLPALYAWRSGRDDGTTQPPSS